MKIYIGCALSHVPRKYFEEYASFLHNLASSLKNGSENQIKYALVDSDPQLATKPQEDRARLCYAWDRRMVEEAEIFIAESSFPSTGLGIEMQIADQRGIPIVLCFKDFSTNKVETIEYKNPDQSHHHLQIGEGFVSLMALGLPTICEVIRYDSPESGIKKINASVARLRK